MIDVQPINHNLPESSAYHIHPCSSFSMYFIAMMQINQFRCLVATDSGCCQHLTRSIFNLCKLLCFWCTKYIKQWNGYIFHYENIFSFKLPCNCSWFSILLSPYIEDSYVDLNSLLCITTILDAFVRTELCRLNAVSQSCHCVDCTRAGYHRECSWPKNMDMDACSINKYCA